MEAWQGTTKLHHKFAMQCSMEEGNENSKHMQYIITTPAQDSTSYILHEPVTSHAINVSEFLPSELLTVQVYVCL